MSQKVDPFIPISGKRKPLTGQYGMQYMKKQPTVTQPAGNTNQKSLVQSEYSKRLIDDYIRPRAIKPSVQPDKIQTPIAPLKKYQTRRVELLKNNAHKEESFFRTKKIRQKYAQGLSKKQIVGLGILGVFLIAIMSQSLQFGEITIGIYALAAIFLHIPSRTTFILVLIAFIAIAVPQITNGEGAQSPNFGVYAFLLLVVCTVSLGLELHKDKT